MDEKFAAIVYKSIDSGENDKRVSLITPFGVRQATMKGVKRHSAKLRAAAFPFAFFEYTAVKRGNTYTITGASQIEDLFGISGDPFKLTAGAIIIEAAASALKHECPTQFIYMLKRLKDVIYAKSLKTLPNTNNPNQHGDLSASDITAPYLAAIRFLQYLIHDAGYGYAYQPQNGELNSPIKLLSALYFVHTDSCADIQADEAVIIKTLIKIIDNFENKFETEIISKKLITSF